jgi:hypothetical protein
MLAIAERGPITDVCALMRNVTGTCCRGMSSGDLAATALVFSSAATSPSRFDVAGFLLRLRMARAADQRGSPGRVVAAALASGLAARALHHAGVRGGRNSVAATGAGLGCGNGVAAASAIDHTTTVIGVGDDRVGEVQQMTVMVSA